MRLLHISDMHFGTHSHGVVEKLLEACASFQADRAILSGDFTQIGSRTEYKQAQDFMNKLGIPSFCVPGNHDIPRYGLMKRFLNPYKRYREYIHEDLCPVFENDEVVIAGLNTARRILPHWNWANGAISSAQLDHLNAVFEQAGGRTRICVMHHPLHKAADSPLDVMMFGGDKAMEAIHALDIDLVLTGHVHFASITTLERTVFLSASTATSSRLRDQENGFNLIDVKDDALEITHYTFKNNEFQPSDVFVHPKNAGSKTDEGNQILGKSVHKQ